MTQLSDPEVIGAPRTPFGAIKTSPRTASIANRPPPTLRNKPPHPTRHLFRDLSACHGIEQPADAEGRLAGNDRRRYVVVRTAAGKGRSALSRRRSAYQRNLARSPLSYPGVVQMPVIRSLALAAELALATLVAARPATAEVLVSLDYQADLALGDCPSAADFERQVVRQLGRDPFRESASRHLVVRLFQAGPRFSGRVEWRDANDEWEGERTFASRKESCGDLARAMALATAIQIQLLAHLDAGAPGRPAVEAKLPPPAVEAKSPPPAVVVRPPPAPPREPLVALDIGVGAIKDVGDSPAFVLPRLAVTLGRPSAFGLRLAASGLGPGAQVIRSEGSAQITRFLITLEVTRFFRTGRLVEPMLAVGVGWQEVSAQGSSAMPSVAPAHDARAFTGIVAAGGGLAFALASQLAVVVEAETLLFRPAVTVEIGSSQAAHLDGATLFVHGGLLARF
jgi:hypothetical protein